MNKHIIQCIAPIHVASAQFYPHSSANSDNFRNLRNSFAIRSKSQGKATHHRTALGYCIRGFAFLAQIYNSYYSWTNLTIPTSHRFDSLYTKEACRPVYYRQVRGMLDLHSLVSDYRRSADGFEIQSHMIYCRQPNQTTNSTSHR